VHDIWIPELTHPRVPLGGESPPGVRQRARAQLDKILADHQPEPLEETVKAELQAILDAATRDLGG
jgi:trimethylamine:corrinoid methyltransferase-like protein